MSYLTVAQQNMIWDWMSNMGPSRSRAYSPTERTTVESEIMELAEKLTGQEGWEEERDGLLNTVESLRGDIDDLEEDRDDALDVLAGIRKYCDDLGAGQAIAEIKSRCNYALD